MSTDFSVVMNVRHQFGDEDINVGAFSGNRDQFPFDCPNVDPTQISLLLFQSFGVSREQGLTVNGSLVYGGVPITSDVYGQALPGLDSSSRHDHPLVAGSSGWVGNVLLIGAGVLGPTGNELVVESDGDNFVVDNVVVMYKTQRGGAIGPLGTSGS
jgi:hypothetical protein